MRIEKRRHTGLKITLIIILFLLAFGGTLGAFFGYQYINKIGIFKIPGRVIYDKSLSKEELDTLKTIFTDELELDKDVTITAYETLKKPELSTGEFLTHIYVPTTTFYTTETSVDSSEYFIDGKLKQCNCGVNWIELDDLSFNETLLAVDGNYYLDTFDQGAIYHVVAFESEKYSEEIAPLVDELFKTITPLEKEDVLTFAQTGVTALSRGMNEKLATVGYDASYFSEKIKDYLSAFDLTHTSNESSFSSYAAHNICSNSNFINTLTDIGLDIVELTGNHNNDCGFNDAEKTIDIYKEKGIKTVGGGKNATEAAIPLEISEKGTNITMLAYNQSTGGATLGDYPGANQYYEEDAATKIKAAKDKGDFVIVDIQYYECSAYASTYEDPICDYANSAAGDQIGFFRHLIDLGADVVVGTSAHQPQTYELYGDGVIYYGLGNLFFDQVWWPGTTRSLILAHYFKDDKLLQTKVVPTVYDDEMQTRLMDEETRNWYLKRLQDARP